ncbi:translation initiation factor IF-2 [Candidatus Gracilibacteria bacterium]|nr:MAG: translation initiation factor IF-2 [Candidatus Gracilibacteria bacterium]PIE85047.1 MAG: translation initiation factor IF-2 [Candidatus Gracilibacteria bacterium]
MTDKKIVDDYYSNITSKDFSEEKKPTTVKKKIRIKAKKVTLKKEKEEDIETSGGLSVDKNTEKKKVKFKKVIEVSPEKKSAKKTIKKPFAKTSLEKKPLNFSGSTNKSIKKPSDKKDDFKKPLSIIKEDKSPIKSESVDISSSETKEKKSFHNKQKSNFKNKDSLEEGKVSHKKNKFTVGKTRGRFRFPEKEEDVVFTRSKKVNKKAEKNIEDIKQDLVSHSGETIVVGDVLSLKELSEKIGVPLTQLMAEFMKNGMMVNINSKIDFDTAQIIADGFDVKLERGESSGIKIKDLLGGKLDELLKGDDDSKLETRCPVVSIMGHVDHGKTSILDFIRNSKITSGEAGGITQSIGAYQITKNGKKITFLDTPGHEAFTIMRARGAKSTDIAILVVAADEGVKPQTIESINHAKEAGIPVIVAINKMDKEGANPDFVKGQLAEKGLSPEDWGGDTPMIPVSAHTGFGIEDLLEMILLISEMKELKANPNRLGIATVIESHLDLKLGPVATVLINAGTINKGDNIVCAGSFGKIKVLKNFESKNILTSLPGDPVLIVGLNNVVEGGDIMQVVSSIDIARNKSLEYNEFISLNKAANLSGIDILMSKIKSGSLKQLKIVLKADTNGSLEAIKASLEKLSTPETNVVIIHSGVGGITESDVIMCEGSLAILVGFGVDVLSTAKGHLDNSSIEFINSKIIYHITERIEKIITGMLDPKEVEVFLSNPKVLAIFYTSKKFMVVGLKLKSGETIEPNSLVRVIRKDKMVGSGKIISMKQGVEEVKLLQGPTECGIKFSGNVIIEEKDELEIYKLETH